MAKDCLSLYRDAQESISGLQDAYLMQVDDAVRTLLGREEDIVAKFRSEEDKLSKKALSEWYSLRDALQQHLIDNGYLQNWDGYNPKSHIYLLQDYIQAYFSIPGQISAIMASSPHRLIAVSKMIKKLISLQKTRWGKKLPVGERAVPAAVVFFAMNNDRFGHVYKYIVDTQNIAFNPRMASSPHKKAFTEIMSKYQSTLTEVVSRYMEKGIPRSVTMDGAPGLRVRGIKLSNGMRIGTVTFLSSAMKDGSMKYLVRIEETGEERWILSSQIPNLGDVQGVVVNKYLHRFTNDILMGQTRFVEWKDDPSKHKYERLSTKAAKWIEGSHESEIAYIFKKIAIKTKHVQDNPDSKELDRGFSQIHETEGRDGYKYRYVILKNKPNLMGAGPDISEINSEKHSAYIVQHKGPEDERWQNYYGPNAISNKRNIENIRSDERNEGLFLDGWHKSNEKKYYGGIVRNGKIDQSQQESDWMFSNLKDVYMKYQPDEKMIVTELQHKRSLRVKEKKDSKTMLEHYGPGVSSMKKLSQPGSNLWETIGQLRILFEEIGNEMAQQVDREQKNLEEYLGKNGKLKKVLEKVFNTEDTRDFLDQLHNILNIHNRIYVDKNGNVWSPNAHFNTIKEYYTPMLFDDGVLDEMLDRSIARMEARRFDVTDSEKLDELNRAIDDLYAVKKRRAETEPGKLILTEQMDQKIDSRAVIAERNVYMKHRSQWTDPTMRRKDGLVFEEYLDSVNRRIYQNQLMVNLIDTLVKTLKSKDPGHRSMVDWLITRTKIAFGDPSAAGGIGKWDYSYPALARQINKLVPGKTEYSPEDVRQFMQHSKSMFSMMLLNSLSALVNRTQTINPAIVGGWQYAKQAYDILDGKDSINWPTEKINALMDYIGVDEQTNMFMDLLSHAGDIHLGDAGLLNIPGTMAQIPTKTFFDYVRLMARNRKGFREKGIPDIDKNLQLKEIDRVNKLLRELKFEKNQYKRLKRLEEEVAAIYERPERSKAQLRKISKSINLYKREENRLMDSVDRRDVRDLRENFMKALLISKEDVKGKNEYEEVATRLRRINGKVADTRMKRMVSWKLGWWFSGLGKDLFTFTGGEKSMRRHTALMTLLAARDAGQLGSIDDFEDVPLTDKNTGKVNIVKIESNLVSEKAVRLARNSVANTMFSMSAVSLSESAIGAGAQIMLYKAYPYQQMQHDWRIMKSWFQGSDNWGERTSRLIQAADVLAKRAWESYTNADPKARQYNPFEEGMDHEAVRVLRLLMTRIMMTGYSMAVEMIPMIRKLFRTPVMKEFSSMLRGGENPAIRIAFRLLVNLAIFASLDDDQWEGNVGEIGWDVARLFLPVFLTFPFYTIYRMIDD